MDCQRIVISQNWLSYGVIIKQDRTFWYRYDFKWSSGFWIVNANSVTHSLNYHSVTCTSLREKLGEQHKSDSPSDRLQESPPFTYCGVDLFGPFTIKNYKKELKRYGVMFTCLCSHVIHIEIAVFRNWFFHTFIKTIYREPR